MRRIFLLLATIGFFGLHSCTINEGTPGRDGFDGRDAINNKVFEIRNVNFIGNNQGNFAISYVLNPKIKSSDTVLVFRKSGLDNGNVIWESLPKTYYFPNSQELDYNYDFTENDISINISYTNQNVLTPNFIQNQLFRILIISAIPSNKSATINNLTYPDAILKYKIDESKFTILN